jgi:hypothetical protein
MIVTKYVVVSTDPTCDKSNRYNDIDFFVISSHRSRLSAFRN